MTKIVEFYKSSFGEQNIPHLYSIGIFVIFDFLYVLSFFDFFILEVINYFDYMAITILLIVNYLIYRFVKFNSEYTPKPFLMYSYFIFGIILFIAVILGKLNIEIFG